jgi:hypothetical protein
MHFKRPETFRALGKIVFTVSFLFALGSPARAQLSASTGSVNFGNQLVGTQSASPSLVQFTNTSTQYSYNIAIITSSLSQFAYYASGSLSVAPGGVLDVWIWFTPSSAQLYSGTLTISAADGSLVQIALQGNGVSPHRAAAPTAQGTLSVSSSSVNFGPISVGGSGSQQVTLANTGAANATIANVNISGAGLSLAGISAGQVLAPGQSVVLYLSLTPTASGNTSGSVAIASDASDPQVTISLSGSGIAPQPVNHSVTLTWNPSPSDGITGYNVYRSSVTGGPYLLITSGADPSTSYTDTNVQSGQTYYYVTTAVNSSSVESSYSSEIAVLVP